MSMVGPMLEGYEQFSFAAKNTRHCVYYRGEQYNPPILLLQELPGLSPGLLSFAERLCDDGFRVYLPWLFGPVGARAPVKNALRLCISREFSYLRAGVSAPVTEWLRALASQISSIHRGSDVGAIGMCITGAFAIPLILNPHVKAAVAAQPSVPCFPLFAAMGIGRGDWMKALNVSAEDIDAARSRLNRGEAKMLSVRYRADRICPKEKLQRLRDEFPTGLEIREYGESDARNGLGHRPHATYTKEYRIAPKEDASHSSRQAYADLIEFLKKNLSTSSGGGLAGC